MRHSNAQASHRAELAAVYVDQQARGIGVADAMMDAVEARARQDGVVQLELWVWDGNAPAIGFYIRHGFEEMGRLPRATLVAGSPRDDLFFVRALDRAFDD